MIIHIRIIDGLFGRPQIFVDIKAQSEPDVLEYTYWVGQHYEHSRITHQGTREQFYDRVFHDLVNEARRQFCDTSGLENEYSAQNYIN